MAYTKQSKKNIWQNYFVGKADQMRPESSLLIHLQCQNHGDAYPATTAELAVTRQRRRPATCTALIGPPYHESEEGRGAKRTTTRRIVGCRRRSEATLLDPASTASAPRRRRRRREMRARAADHLEALSLEIERKLQKVISCPFLSAFRFLPPPPPPPHRLVLSLISGRVGLIRAGGVLACFC